MPSISVPFNSFLTVAESDDLLDESALFGPGWIFQPQDLKIRSLVSAFREIERLCLKGTRSSVEYATSAVIGSEGNAAYVVGDVVTPGGLGTFAAEASFRVATVGPITLQVVSVGSYQDTAPLVAAVPMSGGTGAGMTAQVIFTAQTAPFPRSGLADREGNTLSAFLVPADVKRAQALLAAAISEDSSVEGGGGTGSNIKRAKGGTAEVEFFASVDGLPFPKIVNDYLAQFIKSSSATPGGSGSVAFGTDGRSCFLEAGSPGLNEGLA